MVCFAFVYFIPPIFGVGCRVESHLCESEQGPGYNYSSIVRVSFLFDLLDAHHSVLVGELSIVEEYTHTLTSLLPHWE